MSKVEALRARIAVVLTAAPTYLTAVATLLTGILALTPVGSPVAVIATAIVAGIGSAITIIRRVTPVIAAERGLLPKDEA